MSQRGAMLSIFGFCAIGALLFLALTKKTSIHFALVVVPTVAALFLGFGVPEVGEFIEEGLGDIAQTGIMLTFAVLFFGIMFDAGMFDPIIKKTITVAGGDPLKIVVGTAVIGMVTQLDGSGSSTYLITISSMLPIYLALKMSPLTLAVVTGLASGAMNLVPWGGPTIRAATSLDIDVMDLWVPMIPVQLVGMALVIVASVWLGRKERVRAGFQKGAPYVPPPEQEGDSAHAELKRPERLIPNLLLTATVIGVLVAGLLPLPATFIIAVPLALMLNYRDTAVQQKRIEAHAKSAIYTASVIFSAGVFIGVFSGTGMIDSMAQTLASGVPSNWGDAFPFILAFVAMPLSIFFDPDSFYFGVLPVLSSTAEVFGVEPMAMGRAAIVGHTTLGAFVSPLVGSSWLLVGLSGVHFGDLQKKGIPIAFAIASIMSGTAIAMGLLS